MSEEETLILNKNSEYPECSGDPSDCPENEGYGCCNQNQENASVSSELKPLLTAAADVLFDAALEVLQNDPHQWSARPCQTCRAISSIAKRPFGCVLYAKQKGS